MVRCTAIGQSDKIARLREMISHFLTHHASFVTNSLVIPSVNARIPDESQKFEFVSSSFL